MARILGLEKRFDTTFATALALREKQIQQSYRPIIGVHKWFARRPGTVFRCLLLSEFNGDEPLTMSYWRAHQLRGVIADPFMGGGTPIFEANRLGFQVVGADINPMAYWIVRQGLSPLDLRSFVATAKEVIADVEREVGAFYSTRCELCGEQALVKYFLWVKTQACPHCETVNDLFPGYLLAENTRHPKHVVACGNCGTLNEYEHQPTREAFLPCRACSHPVHVEGPASRQRSACRCCGRTFSYPTVTLGHPLQHRMWAIEYHCGSCKPGHKGRFFKRPDADDLSRFKRAAEALAGRVDLAIPEDDIPSGDETDRLHRWGYQKYRQLFNERQLLGLSILLRRILAVDEAEARHALLTVFSDFLRYQNMLCRYDTYALKCQDIFAVHGFPVGLLQCENNLLGIPSVGAGAFRHFVAKYLRAKEYCEAPFEKQHMGKRSMRVPVVGERIGAKLVGRLPQGEEPQAYLVAAPATRAHLAPCSLDGVFTDPPYFDNVQYAELMDFCYVWLRLGLKHEFGAFTPNSTRTPEELTGNATLRRGLEHFTEGLSSVFSQYAAALKPGAPFVFTYHHNDPAAYRPLVVAILDAGLDCTATLPVAAEMSASLHIAGTGSSVLDSVFVCRSAVIAGDNEDVETTLQRDAQAMLAAGVKLTSGDVRCLAAGHVARLAINHLRPDWDAKAPLGERMARAEDCVSAVAEEIEIGSVMSRVLERARNEDAVSGESYAAAV